MVISVAVGRRYVYVAQPQDPGIKVFSTTGAFVRDIGRRGQGPGEFMDVSSMGLLGDSLLWAFDGQLGRLTFFDANGGLVRTVRVMAQTSVHVLDVVDGAGIFGEAMVSTATPIDAKIPVWLFTLEGRDPRTLVDRKQNGSVLVRVAEGRRGMSFRNPYASPPMAVVTGDRLVLYESDESSSKFFLRWINAKGDTVDTLEQPYRPVPPDRGGFDAIMRIATARGFSARAVVESVKVPEFSPPVTMIVPSEGGKVWLRREPRGPGQAVRWEMYGPSGRLRVIDVPEAVYVLKATESNVWGVYEDGDGVPKVARFSIVERD
jgi:hypothetical protein